MAEYVCNKTTEQGTTCGEAFLTSQELATHTRYQHPKPSSGTGGGGGGGAGGLGEGRPPVKVSTVEEDLRRALVMAEVEATKIDGIVELYTSGDPTPKSLVKIMKEYYYCKPGRIKTAVKIFFKDYSGSDLTQLFDPTSDGQAKMPELESRLTTLEEDLRVRDEQARRGEEKKELDERFNRLEALISASSAQAAAPAQPPSELSELKKQIGDLQDELRDRREDSIRRELDGVKAKLQEQGSADPLAKANQVLELGESLALRLGYLKGDMPPSALDELLRSPQTAVIGAALAQKAAAALDSHRKKTEMEALRIQTDAELATRDALQREVRFEESKAAARAGPPPPPVVEAPPVPPIRPPYEKAPSTSPGAPASPSPGAAPPVNVEKLKKIQLEAGEAQKKAMAEARVKAERQALEAKKAGEKKEEPKVEKGARGKGGRRD